MIISPEKLSVFLKTPRSYVEIVRFFNISKHLHHDVTQQIVKLIKDFAIFKLQDGRYHWPRLIETKIGLFRCRNANYGFVEDKDKTPQSTSVFVAARFSANSLDGDEVRVNVYEDSVREGQKYGVITKILQRNTKTLIGKVVSKNNSFIFEPFNFQQPVHFVWQSSENLKVDKFVQVQIIDFFRNTLKISFLKEIGDANEEFVYVKIPIFESNVPTKFSELACQEAKNIPQNIGEIEYDRVDLRNEIVFTIDGDDTKDFDDAISVFRQGDNYVLKVHIADVSHYVKENSAIDIDAQERGTSIYLPHTVIPMLPEELSNGICSLNPNVDRYTLTMEALIDSKGNNLDIKIYPSVINSKFRLTYKQVNKYFEDKIVTWDNSSSDSKKQKNAAAKMLDVALELHKILHKFKLQQGYVDLEVPEQKIILNEQGYTDSIQIKHRGIGETLIESFMVRANENVAQVLFEKKVPLLYRIHHKPDQAGIDVFNSIAQQIGAKHQIKENVDSIEFAKAVEKIKTIDDSNFIKYSILRCLQKAIYSTYNDGHFGLASKFYTHFTSPIRRYPDLLVHRIIRYVLFEKHTDFERFEEIMNNQASQTTNFERRAVALERKVVSIKKAEYMQHQIGQSFEAQITSAVNYGIFVEIDQKFDALIFARQLPDAEENPYTLAPEGFELSNGHYKFKVGAKIPVILSEVDIWNGKITAIVDLKKLNKIS